MRHLVLTTLLAGLLPLAAAAAGETVPCPQKKAGQWYRFANTDFYDKTTEQLTKIDSVDSDRLFITQNGQALITDKMHNWHKLGDRTATPRYYDRIGCPFSLGETHIYKDVDYDRDRSRLPAFDFARGEKARGTITVTVAPEFESLTVKAGSFKVVKMVADNFYRSSGWENSSRVVSYYAPEIGIWVKSESTETIVRARYRDRLELLEYSLGD